MFQCVLNNGGLARQVDESEPSTNSLKCKKALEDLHDNLQKDFKDKNVKDDILSNEKI